MTTQDIDDQASDTDTDTHWVVQLLATRNMIPTSPYYDGCWHDWTNRTSSLRGARTRFNRAVKNMSGSAFATKHGVRLRLIQQESNTSYRTLNLEDVVSVG